MYKITKLSNGLTIATSEMPQMASVSVGIWVGVGSRYEPPALNGVCHFIEHLLFKGTKKRTARDISQSVEGVGGYLNAFTSEELTCFHSRACADRFDELLDVLADMFLFSQFASDDIRKERDVIKEEIAMYVDQPQQHVQELLNSTLWPGHPLGRPITGTNKSLDGIGREEMVGFMRSNYLTSGTIIAAAGRLSHSQVVKSVSRYAGGFPRGGRRSFEPARHDQRSPAVRLFTRDTEQTQVALGIRTCSRHDERRHALRLLNTILGENMSSRLFQLIREDLGLAYSIYSTPSFFEDTGDMVISAGLDTDNLSKTLKLVLREVKRLTETPPAASELRRAFDYAVGQIDLALESTENQMNWIGEQLLGYGKIHSPDEARRRLSEVRPSHVRAVARDFLRPERFNLALVSPRKTAGDLQRLLEH